jgi:hypothetical protein
MKSLNLRVAVKFSGIGSLGALPQILEVARGFQPLGATEMQVLRDACGLDVSDGHLELFKTTRKYGGDLGWEMHGFPSGAELRV